MWERLLLYCTLKKKPINVHAPNVGQGYFIFFIVPQVWTGIDLKKEGGCMFSYKYGWCFCSNVCANTDAHTRMPTLLKLVLRAYTTSFGGFMKICCKQCHNQPTYRSLFYLCCSELFNLRLFLKGDSFWGLLVHISGKTEQATIRTILLFILLVRCFFDLSHVLKSYYMLLLFNDNSISVQ